METNMRKQYILTTDQLSDADERVITLLGEIGVFSFRNITQKHKNQVQNLGIMEPASIGIDALLSGRRTGIDAHSKYADCSSWYCQRNRPAYLQFL